MSYVLWDMATGNAVAEHPSEQAALAAVAKMVEKHGRAIANDLGLTRESSRGDSKLVAKGAALVTLALSQSPTPRQRPSANPGPDESGGTPRRRE